MEKILCPHCGKELEATVVLSAANEEKEEESVVSVVTSDNQEQQVDTQEPQTEAVIGFIELTEKFNNLLKKRGYGIVDTTTETFYYLRWAYYFADSLYKEGIWMFRPASFPLVCDYRGTKTDTVNAAYNAMQAWLMASELAELVPDSGKTTNTQTELFKLAYELGGGRAFPLFGKKAFLADPYAMREVGSVLYAVCRGDKSISKQIDTYRIELGGKAIPATLWRDLGYQNETVTDAQGNRLGYRMKNLGYFINTRLFLPDAPGPRVEGTTVCELPQPWQQGQAMEQFDEDGNYLEDKRIYNEMVKGWNMMSKTSLAEWNSYSLEKKNRLIQVGAIPSCTKRYLFGAPKKVRFDGIQRRCYDGKTYADYLCFSETTENTGLVLDGPFSDLEGIWRYNAVTLNALEQFIDASCDIGDNFRFATQDPNYGRCRPGCKNTLAGGERNAEHGAPENEIYNIDLTRMVADTDEGKTRQENGFAADSPRSYVSGHSAQAWLLALLFTQMDNDYTDGGRGRTWLRKAYEYSVSRTIGRFHWMSDVIYGRLFGAMALPVINAMTGLKDGYEETRRFVCGETPKEESVISVTLDLVNQSGRDVTLDGEVCLVLANPDTKGRYHGWTGVYNRTPHIRFAPSKVTVKAGGTHRATFTYDDITEEIMDAKGTVVETNLRNGLGFRRPLDKSLLSVANRKSNVLLYIGGDSEVIVCDPLPADVFEDGKAYTVKFK